MMRCLCDRGLEYLVNAEIDFIERSREKLQFFFLYAYSPKTLPQLCSYGVLLFGFLFFVIPCAYKNIINVVQGVFASFLVAWCIEIGHNYRSNVEKEMMRKSYHQLLRQFEADMVYQIKMEQFDIVGSVFISLRFLKPQVRMVYDMRLSCLTDDECIHIDVILRQIGEIRKAIRKEVSYELEAKDKSDYERYQLLDDYTEKVLSSEETLVDFMKKGYDVSLATLKQGPACSSEVSQCDIWNHNIAEIVISNNCYGIAQEMINLMELAVVWRDMKHLSIEDLRSYLVK